MIHDNIEVNCNHLLNRTLLGFLPVFDVEYNSISYYSVENIHPNREYERVVPCYHLEVSDDWVCEQEHFFMQECLPPKSRENLVLLHEIYRDEYIDNFTNKKYIVIFVGCDDGDKIMRFKDHNDAVKFLNGISYYDEIFDKNEMLMLY
ncbi:hypothetical protein GAP32_139 [Cronobacter phage vB_CsaM_GAP32]|uniref:Uncharacterized protein n=1 Tax=Cronobacter phage vB_CsaM_GAP32 TaxID=1141136 RepID=K4FB22_9CAUD|nr:hypothetical protein GAP32_139 [Cronobacter phage vB_CsaM_GAP32]AFC21589.1 hypothetical protein GAP32_139 [Cronobacter phage vB_CsaM_GAP32]